jgi:hypothetical protein
MVSSLNVGAIFLNHKHKVSSCGFYKNKPVIPVSKVRNVIGDCNLKLENVNSREIKRILKLVKTLKYMSKMYQHMSLKIAQELYIIII